MMAEYIDRETMLKYLEENNTADEWIVGQYNADWIYSFIESQPTADVEEVKHGEWIDKFNGKYANPTFVCSNCGEKALLENYINELNQWRYRQSLSTRCPFCGAKMDGGKCGMTLCEECIHGYICADRDDMGADEEIALGYCGNYKNKADFVEVDTLKDWLWELAKNNVGYVIDGNFSEVCVDLISRLDGLRRFAQERSDT
jgi:hypothetical protein